jgi:very-short-patch-repair endonuclease
MAIAKRRKFIKMVANCLQHNTPKSELWFYEILKKHNMMDMFKKNIPVHTGIPDLVNIEYRIIVEIDGSVHDLEEVQKTDKKRQLEYESVGYDVFRVKHGDSNAAEAVLSTIKHIISQKSHDYTIHKLRKIKDEKQGALRPDPINKQLQSIASIMATDKKSRPKKIR